MRLAKLELLAYGPFRGLTLDFSAPGLHVVLGPNEAGKSTTLRAITGLLYGIDRVTPDAHVHKPSELRIGGVIEGPAGERLHVVRRKGNTKTLLDTDGRPIDESLLAKLLGGVSQATFRHAFGLDHQALEAGAEALLEGKGDLGESLFDASVGGGGEVQRLLSELASEADALYKPRATTLPLNEALKAYNEAKRLVVERESRPEAFVEQERALATRSQERDALVEARSELLARRARLERAMRRLPLERRRDRALERRAELGAVALHVARIEALRDRFTEYERALEQRRTSLAEAERLVERVAEAARRGAVDPAIVRDLAFDTRTEGRIHALVGDRAALSKNVEAAGLEIERLERELARAVEAAGEGREPNPAEGRAAAEALARALERARALGDIEARIATERARLARRRSDLERKAASLGRFEGSLEELVALPLPAEVAVERLDERAVEVARTIARLDERASELEAQAARIETQLAACTGELAPPDTAALRSAREERDRAWRAVREAQDDAARRSAEIEMERALRQADAVADRMITEADRVTTIARLRSEAETNARQREKIRAARAQALEARESLDAELAALFAGTGVRPGGFAEMVQWLERHGQVKDLYDDLREAEAAVQEEESKAEAAKRALGAALAGASRSSDVDQAALSLADLVGLAAHRAAEIEHSERAAARAKEALADLRVKLDERVIARSHDESKLAETSAKLGELLAPLGLRADAPLEEVARAIEAVRELFELETKRADAESRARFADRTARELEAELSRAIADLAPDLTAVDLPEAARTLFSRCAIAKEIAQELATVERQLDEEEEVVLDDDERALVGDPEAARRTQQELEERIGELDEDITRLTERIGALRSGLERMRADSHAAEAATSAQIHLARVREYAERWARVKLASFVLGREIERYREENQGPLLASSSALFSRLTLGAFQGIKAGFDDKDRPCLRCIRADASEVDVAGLSDGTRDQLYLSLRLASLVRRREVADPMPLVLDDVLIHFDDQRASAALAVLAEISRQMQVLFFTHHARLVELARAVVSERELIVHELAPSGSRPAAGIAAASG